MDAQPNVPATADALFNAPDADLVLRSSDNVEFAVQRSIVRLISTVFDDTLSLPQGPDADATSVQMFEDSSTLRLLLQACYPRSVCNEPDLKNILDIKRAAALAQKYDIAFLHEKVTKALCDYCDVSPALAYAVSWRFSYDGPLRVAARRSLDIRDFFKTLVDSEDAIEFEEITSTAFVHLYRYHSSVKGCLEGLLHHSKDRPITWIQPARVEGLLMHAANGGEPMCTCITTLWFREEGNERALQWQVYGWWWNYVCAVISAVQSEYRAGLDIALDEPLLEWMRAAVSCDSCHGGIVAPRILRETRHSLETAIEDCLRTIPLPLGMIS
ncbi:unnamed protein product [Peniophora sp. CBMAI 1063]|nr:unnamed protein product [Peniophora sp. CBMAI 1063]